jgi:hypothetical protein
LLERLFLKLLNLLLLQSQMQNIIPFFVRRESEECENGEMKNVLANSQRLIGTMLKSVGSTCVFLETHYLRCDMTSYELRFDDIDNYKGDPLIDLLTLCLVL